MSQRQIPPAAWAQLLLLALIWGGSFPGNRVAVHAFGVAPTVALRVGIGALVMWSVVAARGLPLPRAPRVWASFLLMGFFNSALPFALIVWGQTRIDSGLAAILNTSTAILGVTVAAIAFRDERLGLRKAAGVALGVFGVSVTLGLHRLAAFDPASIGQLAVLGAALSYAFGGVIARLASTGTAPEVSAAGMLTGATVFALPAALIGGTAGSLPGTGGFAGAGPVDWFAVCYLGAVATGLAYLLYFRLIALAGVGNTSLVTLMVAPISILLGALFFGEALPARAFAGFALIAAGLVTIDGRLLRRKPRDVAQMAR
ncbi:DMT family transporter [Frigidibacter sp. MR17.14]|uniref:DMT family transporter n=1 Tax=Frigidibacter sp. MR17.14 TaxID=3126509 RepID=UPI0030131873